MVFIQRDLTKWSFAENPLKSRRNRIVVMLIRIMNSAKNFAFFQKKRSNEHSKKLAKHYFILCLSLLLITSTSCTTTRKTISRHAYNSAVEDAKRNMSFFGSGYKLSGSGSETKNEIQVTGQSYSKYTGFGTLMQNDYSTYDSYLYIDSLGNEVEYQYKFKTGIDRNGKEYLYGIEVTKCNCQDNKIYPYVCGDTGFVKKVTQVKPDQQSVFIDREKSLVASIVGGIGAGLLSILILLPIL